MSNPALSYPPALGIYNPAQLPNTWDPLWSATWKYSEKSVAELGKLAPDEPFDPVRSMYHLNIIVLTTSICFFFFFVKKHFIVTLAQKEVLIPILENDDRLEKATPDDVRDAFEKRPNEIFLWPRQTPVSIFRTQ